MATVGAALTAPETGWRRLNDRDQNISYIGTWTQGVATGGWNADQTYTSTLNDKIRFNFTGTSLRIIGTINNNRSTSIGVYIDDVYKGDINQYAATVLAQALDFDITGLENKEHYVEIINNATGGYGNFYSLDAIDIGATNYLRPYNINPKQIIQTNVNAMNVGDIIPCRYTATAGVAGTFSEIGTCIAAEIPWTGTAAPDGLFYFIKTDKGLFIADRVIQTNISWNTLNSAKFIQGTMFYKIVSPLNMTANNLPAPYVATCDSNQLTDYAYNAFDPSPITFWTASSTYPTGGHWVKIDIGSKLTIGGMLLQAGNISATYSGIKDWILYGSDDDIQYTSVASGQNPNDTNAYVYNFPTVSYRYYRLNIVSCYYTSQNYCRVGQIIFYDPIKMFIRSLTGGNAYLGTDGKASLTDKNLGAFPSNNEWDKYVVKGDLSGKIVAGSDNVWHNSASQSWCQDTTNLSIYNASQVRTTRGYNKINGFTYNAVTNSYGFRPVIEYTESTKGTNIWY